MPFSTVEQLLLESLSAAIGNKHVSWNKEIAPEDWAALLNLAADHKVLPLVYEAVYPCPAAQGIPVLQQCKQLVVSQVMGQTMKSGEFLSLYAHMRKAGLHPLVVKGIVCRSLYHKGDHRPSGDEDLYVTDEEFDACRQFMRNCGMLSTNEDSDDAFEIGWSRPGSYLHIELHRRLFDPDSAAHGSFALFFTDAAKNAAEYPVGSGQSVMSLNPHDHMLYLLLHAYKHFIYCGFGIRQVCDIGLWAQKFSSEIDWSRLYAQCQEAHALRFSAAVFQITEKYLGMELHLPGDWSSIKTDCDPLLKDLLAGGVYGGTDQSRIYSSTVTLETVAASRQNRKAGILLSVFPSKNIMASRYPFVRKHPYLLPAAWVARIFSYGKKNLFKKDRNNTAETLRIAKERTELLKMYDMI